MGFLVTAAALVYANTLFNGFAQDDEIYILQNHAVTTFAFRELLAPNYFSRVFRPLTFLTFAGNWLVSGARPFSYHLANLLLHLLVTLLVYHLLKTLLQSHPEATTMAFASALLFAVHPLHTEAVAAIVGRSELLAAALLLAAWLLHMGKRNLLSVLLFALAMLAKESAIVFLPLVVITDFALRRLKPAVNYVSFAIAATLYLTAYWKLQGGHFSTVITFLDNPLVNLPPGLRIMNALRVAWKYAELHVYPAALSCDYSYAAITLYSNWRAVWPVVATALVLALWIWSIYTPRAPWAVAGAIYVVGFSVTANLLFPIGTIMGERLAYLPSIGFCLAAAILWAYFHRFRPTLAWLFLITVLAALSVRAAVRNRDWRDNFTLYSAAIQVVPGSAKMHNAIASQYAQRGEIEAARAEFQTALRIYPSYPEALESFGLLESNMGREQESRRLLESALSLAQKGSVNYDFAVVNLAAEYVKLGDNDRALKLLDQDILDSPTYARAWANRAVIRYKSGQLASARSDAETALRLDPSNSQAQALLSLLNSSPPLLAPK